MFGLARCFGEGPVPMSTVVERQDLSPKHLHAQLTFLKSTYLVRSVLGSGVGFVLTRPPTQIRLSEILRDLERAELGLVTPSRVTKAVLP